MASQRYTLDQVRQAVAVAASIRQVLILLGLVPQGGSYRTIAGLIARHAIDTSHFAGRAWNKGQTIGNRRPLAAYLVKDGPRITAHKLKLRMIAEGVFEPRCSCCSLNEWLGKPIPLELEHCNGDPMDNRLPNLCLLCPNCHALTPTYRGRNQRRANSG
jgi:hypothetical protein